MKIDAVSTVHYTAFGEFKMKKLDTGGWDCGYFEQKFESRSDAFCAAEVLKRGGCENVAVRRVVEHSGYQVDRKIVSKVKG